MGTFAAVVIVIVILGILVMVITVRRSGRTGGQWSRHQRQIEENASREVAAMQEEDEEYFRPDGPAQHEDDL
jgi:hypothetical protein